MRLIRIFSLLTLLLCNGIHQQVTAQEDNRTIARHWMDELLENFKLGLSRPTVNARNMYHVSGVMYDAWAVYDSSASPHFLGQTIAGFEFPYAKPFALPKNMNEDSALNVTINYAVHTLLTRRYRWYGSKTRFMDGVDSVFEALGGDLGYDNRDYSTGSPAAFGNYLGTLMYEFGHEDGSNEEDRYENTYYEPRNDPLRPELPGAFMRNPNLWQPIKIGPYIKKKGPDQDLLPWQTLAVNTQDIFLSASWGDLPPFALTAEDKKKNDRDGYNFNTYLDPGPPPFIRSDTVDWKDDPYKWGFVMVALWGAHHDPNDGEMIEISPRTRSKRPDYPETYADYHQFYDIETGGARAEGLKINPKTKQPYKENRVKRGDYGRAIAEYWVDGVNTYTPPGHWIKTFNQVTDNPSCERKWMGKGKTLPLLEWEIKSYFVIGGGMHDAAIAAWGVKSWYDYVRPISAIRWMAGNGQCSDQNAANFHPQGLPLIPGNIELVTKKDPLAGPDKEHVGKIKIKSWRGPDAIENTHKDIAGVGWILAENWWPYQRYTFITPPFAGYVSGHSTYSVAAAEILTQITGDEYFPGGLGSVTIGTDFLEFEDGPSHPVVLQWATYHDAANETCLSRIWGGIHPPCDDMQGRKMGMKVAGKALEHANLYYKGKVK